MYATTCTLLQVIVHVHTIVYTNIDMFPSLPFSLYTVGLFVSNMKILELMKELQHVQDSSCLDISKQDCTTVSSMEDVDPCQARIGISGEIIMTF